jgi:hypothetical protein
MFWLIALTVFYRSNSFVLGFWPWLINRLSKRNVGSGTTFISPSHEFDANSLVTPTRLMHDIDVLVRARLLLRDAREILIDSKVFNEVRFWFDLRRVNSKVGRNDQAHFEKDLIAAQAITRLLAFAGRRHGQDGVADGKGRFDVLCKKMGESPTDGDWNEDCAEQNEPTICPKK